MIVRGGESGWLFSVEFDHYIKLGRAKKIWWSGQWYDSWNLFEAFLVLLLDQGVEAVKPSFIKSWFQKVETGQIFSVVDYKTRLQELSGFTGI